MAGQTTHIENNGRTTRGIFGNAAEFVHDLVTLSELQVKLLVVDLREGSRHALLPLGLIVLAGCLALGVFPILLAALALGLAAAGLSYWLSFLLAALIGVIISGATGYGGYVLLKKQAKVLRRSQEEFERNVHWVKSALTQRSRPAPY